MLPSALRLKNEHAYDLVLLIHSTVIHLVTLTAGDKLFYVIKLSLSFEPY
jgi:hypothetical protein